ncbi:ABC transporter permease [Nonomuraea turcica]|uniref:ABC transporter permease n=1 Tax=Nonomuraea sp. G32 TaxID=3067274 RepID=UPI00273CAAAE|nr:ABC transporter permease [Nonomuraea sp. G32]MDP4506960.1 ABC transporter permease [Nonomuraea sp. G32]
MRERRPALWLYLLGALIAGFLILPAVITVPMSFSSSPILQFPPKGLSTRWYENLFTSHEWRSAAFNSFGVGLVVTVLTSALGIAAALGMDRVRFRGKSLLNAFFLGPMLVPIVIVAVGSFSSFSHWRLTGTFLGLVLGHTVLALPFAIVSVGAGIRQLDRTLERAAQTLGAGPFRTFRTVTFPLLLPNIAVGALFAFITSWDEVVVSLFLSDPATRTLPVQMFSQLRTNLDPTIAAVATLLTSVTVVLLVVVMVLGNRRRTA